MPVLNTARCVACPEEVQAANYNELVWTTQELGWVTFPGPDHNVFVCPRHEDDFDVTRGRAPGPGIKWLVFCHTCDWEEEFFTEDECESAKRKHDCDDWRDEWPDVKIQSPQQRLENAEKTEEYRRESARRRKAEKEAVEAEAERVAWLEKEVTRLQSILDKRTSPWKRMFGWFRTRHTPNTESHTMTTPAQEVRHV